MIIVYRTRRVIRRARSIKPIKPIGGSKETTWRKKREEVEVKEEEEQEEKKRVVCSVLIRNKTRVKIERKPTPSETGR